MKLGRLAVLGLAVGLLGSSAYAGNGSNFWHYQNGIDYYIFYAFPPQSGSAAWRCFPGAINHAPTKVVNALDVNVGTYASKIETLWFNTVAGGPAGGAIVYPYVAVWSNTGTCTIATSAGANWGVFSGLGAGMVVLGGPLNGANLQLNALATNVVIPGSAALGFINTIRLDVVPSATGAPSAITIPEGATTTLVQADKPGQGFQTGQYFTASVDDRKVCSAFGNSGLLLATAGPTFFVLAPFIATGGAPPTLPIEWGNAVSTIDSVVELDINTAGPGPAGLNPGPTYALPYDNGNNGVISITGTTLNAPTAGEIFGVSSFDDNNPFGGSNHLTYLNFSGIQTGYPAPIPMCPTAGGLMQNPATAVPTGGAGGPTLSVAIPQQPRLTGKVDFVTTNLLANPLWTNSTVHGVVPFGIDFPFFPTAVKCGGSSGNNGGAQIAIPPIGTLVGLEVAMWQSNMNAAGTAIAKLANNGHSHTNITPIGFAPCPRVVPL
jgi:hypothetical protein